LLKSLKSRFKDFCRDRRKRRLHNLWRRWNLILLCNIFRWVLLLCFVTTGCFYRILNRDNRSGLFHLLMSLILLILCNLRFQMFVFNDYFFLFLAKWESEVSEFIEWTHSLIFNIKHYLFIKLLNFLEAH
jgi:hypothetical protein